MPLTRFLWSALVLFAPTALSVRAATFVVNSTRDAADASLGDGVCETSTPGECTFRAAIDESSLNAEADRIELPEGVFPGGLTTRGRMHVVGAGPEKTIIDGRCDGPALRAGSTLTLFDLTLTNGCATEGAGGLEAPYGSSPLSLVNVHVTDCTGEVGGVRAVSEVALTDVVIERCSGPGLAGGLRLSSQRGGHLTRCRISDNVGPGLSAYVVGRLVPLTIRDCTFERNRTLANGGAIQATLAFLTIDGTTIAGNEAMFGGAVHVANWTRGNIFLTNSTISGNTAGRDGGGIYGSSTLSTMVLRNTTLVGNRAMRGGGLFVHGAIELQDGILFGNDAGEGPDCIGTIHGAGNLVGDISGCAPDPGVVLTTDDPLLGPLADNGGLTSTHALLPGSPAIDAGLGQALNVDQRGAARPSGQANDLGAYELDVTTDTDGDGIPNFIDNCVDVVNESQLDDDGDGRGDECDCAPSEASSWAVPEAVTLLVTHAGSVGLQWTDVSGLAGSGVVHDIASDTIASLREHGVADGECLEIGWPGTTWLDTDAPAVGDVYYLVRAVNACGPGPGEGWGGDSFADPRPACP